MIGGELETAPSIQAPFTDGTSAGPHGGSADPDRLWREPSAILDLMAAIAPQVFRADTSRPGFAVVDLGPDLDLARFRSLLLGFYAALDGVYLRSSSRRLVLRSVGRFNQHVSTQPHLDGAPAESVLLLGYEPSAIHSRLFFYDYTRCAADRGLTPDEFLERFNPTSEAGRAALEGYRTEAEPFEAGHYRVVVINNSRLPPPAPSSGMLGVLHQSAVAAHDSGQSRFISTMLMSPADARAEDLISADAFRAYVESGTFAAP